MIKFIYPIIVYYIHFANIYLNKSFVKKKLNYF